jgi:hypothetical protein
LRNILAALDLEVLHFQDFAVDQRIHAGVRPPS